MAKKTFRFPKGTEKISAKEWAEVLSTYEKVEVPGSVVNVSINTEGTDITTKEIVFHKGTQQLSLISDKKTIFFNIPTTVHTIRNWNYNGENLFHTSRILILGIGVMSAEGIQGPEYLQYYSTTRVASYNGRKQDLKHLVYLGTKIDQKYGSYNVPDGCVIHVEQKKTALSILKRVNVDTVFVIPDAAEWKDFPADKLAMTMEEYNPESRILPEQKKMREEKEKARVEEKEQELIKQRQIRKERLLQDMSAQVVKPVLAPLFGTFERETWNGQVVNDPAYRVKIIEEKEGADNVLELTAIIEPNLFDDRWKRSLAIEFRMLPTEITDKMVDISHHFTQIKDFVAKNKEMFSKYHLDFHLNDFCKNTYTPGLSLPFQDYNIVAQLNKNRIQEDVEELTKFVSGFSKVINEAKVNFPLGVLVKKY